MGVRWSGWAEYSTGAQTQDTALAAHYQRITERCSAKRVIIAMAHRLLIIAYGVIAHREPYRKIGAHALDRQPLAATANHLLRRRLRQLSTKVQVLSMTHPPEPAETPYAPDLQ